MGSLFFAIILLTFAFFKSKNTLDKKTRLVFIWLICILTIPIIYTYAYKPYFTSDGKETRLWNEQKKKTMEAMGIACYLKKDNPVYIRLKVECENWKRGDDIYAGVGFDYFPDNIPSEPPPEPRPFGN